MALGAFFGPGGAAVGSLIGSAAGGLIGGAGGAAVGAAEYGA